jgi:hypothetical protein
MSFLDITSQQRTGVQINSWLNSLNLNIDLAKEQYNNITNWLWIINDNTDYTEEDKQAVVIKLQEAITKIESLLPNKVN